MKRKPKLYILERKPKFDWKAWLWDQAAKATRSWIQASCKTPHAVFHLYYKCGELTVAADRPDATWVLGSITRLRLGQDAYGVCNTIYELARRLPCLPNAKQQRKLIAEGYVK